ncbi:membrane protein [Pelistega indica]|uniref:Membrane protein n=1 Tax=Pelistega indica TaxID=1414851 RepID=V8G3U8_9BURK|nr:MULTISPECIES: patatin-like phospholipase family protein [Pelistega]ETD70771.1 membrane protein [Pelistega indica]
MQSRLKDYDSIALVLQGGGALGSYQAGVFEGLSAQNIQPDFIAGISIGALNAAIIAGNPPETRIEQLRKFWDRICTPYKGWSLLPWLEGNALLNNNNLSRWGYSHLGGLGALMEGQKGFFKPRRWDQLAWLDSSPETVSFYDTSDLKQTLLDYCDFDRINSKHSKIHIAVGAVQVRTGNFVYFDNRKEELKPEHFMASGALPPAFAPVEINGEFYWDGGVVSNTPLDYVLNESKKRNHLVFQVDLWSARGEVPRNLWMVANREQEIRYSSRTRFATNQWKYKQKIAHLLAELLKDIPEEHRKSRVYKTALAMADIKKTNVVQLIYRNKSYEVNNKEFQFSEATMRMRWESGLEDIQKVFDHPELMDFPTDEEIFTSHDTHHIVENTLSE